jgi:hypothetical protein
MNAQPKNAILSNGVGPDGRLKTTIIGATMNQLVHDLGLQKTSTTLLLAAAVVHPSGLVQSEHVHSNNLTPDVAVMMARMLLTTWGPQCSSAEGRRLTAEAADLLGTDYAPEKNAQ